MASSSLRMRKGAVLATRDFVLGLFLFWGVTLGICAHNAPAQALTLPQATYATGPAQLLKAEKASYYATVANGALRELNPTHVAAKPTMAVLSFVFALLLMMNLAFLRHVRRAYSNQHSVRSKI